MGEFGRALDAELKSVKGKTDKEIEAKTRRILTRWLDGEQKYREPPNIQKG